MLAAPRMVLIERAVRPCLPITFPRSDLGYPQEKNGAVSVRPGLDGNLFRVVNQRFGHARDEFNHGLRVRVPR